MEIEKIAQEATDPLVDESVIDYLLSLSIEQRIDSHESARRLAEDLKEAGRQLRARPKEATPTPA